jgi:uncharacterized protein (DUF488 family)
MRVFTIGHGTRPAEELLACLAEAGVATLVDVRRFPASRRHPQFDRDALEASLAAAGVAYRHAVELGGRRSGEPGEERFACIRVAAFRSYAARMGTAEWQAALESALVEPEPCFMCAETLWWRCHRRLIADALTSVGVDVLHIFDATKAERHRLTAPARLVDGELSYREAVASTVDDAP